MKAFVALPLSGLLPQGHLFRVNRRLSFAIRPNKTSDHRLNSPGGRRNDRWILPPTVPGANTLLNPSNKLSCRNVSNTLRTVNVINKRCHQPALIATWRYAAPNLPNHHFPLVTQITVPAEARLCKTPHVNRTNQISLTAAIRSPTKKGYIRLTTKLWRINQRVFTPRLTQTERMLHTRTKALMKWW